MTLWFVLALMTAAAMFAVLWPLARRAGGERSGSDLAVYRDQLDEIARDRAAGLIGEREAEAAKVEVSRRLLAAADAQSEKPAPAAPSAWRRRAVALAAVVLMPVGAGGLYLALGSPTLPGQPLAERAAAQKSIDDLIKQVEAHLAAHPDDGRGWEVIAPVYIRLGRFDDAVKARRNALRLLGETADRQADLGEALVLSMNGIVSPEAKAAFQRAVAIEPGHVRARYFLGRAAEQTGDVAEAVRIWRAMLVDAPGDAPWVAFVRQELARVEAGPAQRGPTEEDIAAASDISGEQRLAMIRGMVEKLAERLHQDGSDLEGWLRLMRSYMVLGEREKALTAVGEARRALGNDPEKLRRIEELAKGLGLEG